MGQLFSTSRRCDDDSFVPRQNGSSVPKQQDYGPYANDLEKVKRNLERIDDKLDRFRRGCDQVHPVDDDEIAAWEVKRSQLRGMQLFNQSGRARFATIVFMQLVDEMVEKCENVVNKMKQLKKPKRSANTSAATATQTRGSVESPAPRGLVHTPLHIIIN